MWRMLKLQIKFEINGLPKRYTIDTVIETKDIPEYKKGDSLITFSDRLEEDGWDNFIRLILNETNKAETEVPIGFCSNIEISDMLNPGGKIINV